MGKQQSLWKLREVVMQSLWNRCERCAIALKTPWSRNANALESLCNRGAVVLQSPWTPRKRCAITVGHLGVPTATSLRCHDVLGDCTALSRRLHGVPTAFFKGRRSHGVCNLQQNANAVPRRSRRFHGVSWQCHGGPTAMLAFCTAIWWRSRSPWERRPSVTGVEGALRHSLNRHCTTWLHVVI
jgi:hypothetical protein